MELRKEKEKRVVDGEERDRLSSTLPVPPIFAVSQLCAVLGGFVGFFLFPLGFTSNDFLINYSEVF